VAGAGFDPSGLRQALGWLGAPATS
jgi:hypothetical protein